MFFSDKSDIGPFVSQKHNTVVHFGEIMMSSEEMFLYFLIYFYFCTTFGLIARSIAETKTHFCLFFYEF